MQSLEQEVTLGAITSILEIVRNSETSTKSFIPYLELQEQICMWEQEMYQMSNFNDAHAFTSGLLSTYSHLKWEFLN